MKYFSFCIWIFLGLWACSNTGTQNAAQNTTNTPVAALDANDPIVKGKKLFKLNCGMCHALEGVIIGPALKGITQKHSLEWLVSFTQNSQAMIKAGDPKAVAIYEEYNKVVMTSFSHLPEEDIKAIFAYIASEGE
jgi:cytochrome c2